jgi:lysophospholipase L1-like esterase
VIAGRTRARDRSRGKGVSTRPCSIAALTTADTNSLVSSDLANEQWSMRLFPTYYATADVASVGDGADGITPTYYVNRGQTAMPYGVLGHQLLAPPGATSITFSFEAKRPTGVGTNQAATLSIVNADHSVAIATTNATITSTWQTFSVQANVTAGLEYEASITCNDAGGTQQSRFLVRNAKVTQVGGTGVFASSFVRYDLQPKDSFDGSTGITAGIFASYQFRQRSQPAMARYRLTLSAAANMYFEGCVGTNAYQTSGDIAIVQSGALVGGVTYAPALDASLKGWTVAVGAGNVDVIGGDVLGVTVSGTYFSRPAGTRAVYLPASVTVQRLQTSRRRIVILGDSIAGGLVATPASTSSWPQLVRDALPNTPIVCDATAGGTLFQIAGDASKRSATVTRLMLYGTGQVFVIQLSTNDWGEPAMTDAAYGTALAALLDAIRAADTTATVVLMTALKRTNEAVANANGDVLEDFRAQMRTAHSTRTAYCKLLESTVDLLTTTPADDGVHPNNAESATIATNVVAWFQSNGLA